MPGARNYPWDMLAIDETDDKKVIKKAYAILIKQYKPDEYPEKFQEIQEAYKYALDTLTWNAQITSTNTDENDEDEDFNFSTINIDHESSISDEATIIIDEIIRKTEQLLKSDLMDRESIHNWRFIEKSNSILDIKTREIFSQKLFSLVSEHNTKFFNRNKKPILSTAVMQHINDFVDWSSKWQDYSFTFDSRALQLMYIAIEGDDGKVKIEPIDLGIRVLALFSDLTASYFFAAYFYYFKDYTFSQTLILTFKIFVISRFVIELIFKQSLGKSNRNIFIEDKFGNRCTLSKTIIRHFIINLTLLPIYVWIFNIPINSNIWIGILCIMIFFHLLSISKGEKLFHDILTKTILFRRE